MTDEQPPDDPTAPEPPDDDQAAENYAWDQDVPSVVPAQALTAEQAVLGAMLISPEAIDNVLPIVQGPDFYRPNHETIWDAILDLFGRGEPVDMLTVGALLAERGELVRIGGAPYLHTLASQTPTAAYVPQHAAMVADAAVRRRMVEAGTRIVQWFSSPQGDTRALTDRAESEVMSAVRVRTAEDYVQIGDFIMETIDAVEAAESPDKVDGMVPTGFLDLDELLGGFAPGQMVTIAGRPAMGKSTLALDVCRHASIRHDMPSAFFSLEMTRTEIGMRVLSAEAKVPLHHLRNGHMTSDDWDKVSVVVHKIARAPLYVDDSPNLTMTEIRSKARRLKQTNGLDVAAIDYMQLMTSGQRVESRQLEVSEFSRQIKLLAKELGIPVLALSQLNRGPEQRTNKRPMMSDLRESGSIEQDSDIVILLHREDAYEVESSRPGEADLIVAKHRNGATRDIVVAFQGHYSRFIDMYHG